MNGTFFALVAALLWGSADFSGGMVTRRIGPFQTLVLVASSGLLFLLISAGIRGEFILSTADFLWAASAGVVGAIGLAALYRGLATGNTAVVAPTAAVVGTALPVILGSLLEGYPGVTKVLGFLAGASGIGLVSNSSSGSKEHGPTGLGLAIFSGMCFGFFFVLIAEVHSGALFAPLAVAKASSLSVGLISLAIKREKLPPLRGNHLALIAGVLDAGGTLFYVLATQATRLDIAVVLSAMYPAPTVFLARLLFGERISLAQWSGVILCLVAISLIAI